MAAAAVTMSVGEGVGMTSRTLWPKALEFSKKPTSSRSSGRGRGRGTAAARPSTRRVAAQRQEQNPGTSGAASSSSNSNQKRLSKQSSWEAVDSEGNDYLVKLGKESENMNIAVGAKQGVIDDVFIGDFLGKDADIVFKYRQKVTREFNHLQGDYYIAPALLEKVVMHIMKNYILPKETNVGVPLILGKCTCQRQGWYASPYWIVCVVSCWIAAVQSLSMIYCLGVWGAKGQGKSFQCELIFKALGVEPVIMSAGELEGEWAGILIRQRYKEASASARIKGKLGCLMINDLDAGIGRFANTQLTVNNQMVVGSLMNLADNPEQVSIGEVWREDEVVQRIPIIVTGNDLSTIYAPLIRDGRMEKFLWQPTREDIIKVVHRMYRDDGFTERDIAVLVDAYPDQPLDFYGAMRSRTYDDQIRTWIKSIGGEKEMGKRLVNSKEAKPSFDRPALTLQNLLAEGRLLVEEQNRVATIRLSEQYMPVQTGEGSSMIGFKG
eukprot:jgi/Chlat1/7076/Chrsp57S06774